MNYQMLKETLLEEGVEGMEIFYLASALSGGSVVSVQVVSTNEGYSGWVITKDDRDLFRMEKVQ